MPSHLGLLTGDPLQACFGDEEFFRGPIAGPYTHNGYIGVWGEGKIPC